MKTRIVLGLLAVWIGSGLIVPGIASVMNHGALPAAGMIPYSIGIVLALVGMSMVTYGFARRRVAV